MTAHIESYEQAVEFLFSRINYERLGGSAYTTQDFKLDRMREFLARLGNPHEKIPAVHIAGTKGKGSTAAMIASVLTSAGVRTGLFTSPHISVFEERMSVDGRLPAQAEIVALINRVSETVEALDNLPGPMSPTYFEIATALAWLFFEQRGVQLAVLEVGLGGRLDATNLCRPEVTVITTISRDHTRQLGSRLSQIAREKAGIVKPGIPVICGVTADESLQAIHEVCAAQGAPLLRLGHEFGCGYHPAGQGTETSDWDAVDVWTESRTWERLRLPLVGAHQAHNAALAVAAIAQLQRLGWNIDEQAIRDGLSAVRWPGRIEVLCQQPTVIVDAAHNWESVAALLRTLEQSFSARRKVLVFAATQDKDVAGMLRQLLPRFDTIILTSYQNNPRGVPLDQLVRLVRSQSDVPVHCVPDTVSAWKLSRRLATSDDLICVTGSFFIAAELRELIIEDARQTTPPVPLDCREAQLPR